MWTLGESYLLMRVREDSLGIVVSRDDSRELTRKSIGVIFVLHLA